MRRHFLHYFGFLTVLILLGLELSARRLSPAGAQLIAWDSDYGWTYLRNARFRIRDLEIPGGEFPVRINSHGFRGEWPLSSEKSLLFLGDSYAVGLALPEGFTFPRLFSHHTQTQVRLAAVAAWATDQELLYFLKEGASERPKTVFLMISPNDIRESYGKHFFEKTSTGLTAVSIPIPDFFDRLHLALMNRSAAYQWLSVQKKWKQAFDVLWKSYPISFPLKKGRYCQDRDLFEATPDPEVVKAEAYFEALVGELKRACDLAGSQLILSVNPTKMEFDGRLRAKRFEPAKVSQDIRRLANSLSVPYFDLRAEFAATANPLSLFLKNDYHFSKAGHLLAARVLAEQFSKLSATAPTRSR